MGIFWIEALTILIQYGITPKSSDFRGFNGDIM